MSQEEEQTYNDTCLATQPANDISFDSDSSINAWAKLTCFSQFSHQNQHWLDKDEFVVGRQSSCDYHFESGESQSKIYPLISKIHFIIEKHVIRGTCVAFLKDVSSNGTFVNDQLVGRDQRHVLSNDDVISVGKVGYQLFTFFYIRRPAEFLPREVSVEYHLINRISKGGFGVVYYVLEKKTCVPFAMKMVNEPANIHEHLDVFTELKILQSIKHKNIVEFHGTIMKDDKLFLILEYMAGGDLAHLLALKSRLSEPVARHIFYQLVNGVDYLHKQQIVHRDIKPLNILLMNQDEYPLVKITDFGLSKMLKKMVSSVKEIVGTPAYRAPELRGERNRIFDARVDIWSLGVMLYVCLCGKYPFEAEGRDMTPTLKFDPLHIWYHISKFPKNIIKRSLRIDFKQRPFCCEILCDDWFKKNIENYHRLENPMKKLRTT